MGNDSSKLQAQPHPGTKVQRRLSTDSGRYCRSSPTLPASNSSISCSDDAYLSPNMSNCSSRQSIDNGSISRSRSGSASSERSNSFKTGQKHPIVLKNRQLIQSCFTNSHEILGRKIIKRTAERRADFRSFYSTLNNDEKDCVESGLKILLKKAVANIDFLEEIQRLSEEFGERFVSYRSAGFKADYFAAVSESTITECTFLDNAVHPAHQTLAAFSQFVGIIFNSIRDGFYNGMRRMRRSSHSFSTGARIEVPRQPRLSIASADSPRSKSPAMKKLTDQVFSPTLLVNGSAVQVFTQ